MALYEYERFDGTVISGLTIEQALEEEKKDKVLQQQQTADASLGPQISAGIHSYESSKGPQQPMQTLGNDSSSPMSALGSPGPSQNTNPAPNTTVARFGEDGFMDTVNNAVKQQQAETPSPFEGTPASDSLFSSLSGNGGAMSQMAAPGGNQNQYLTPEAATKQKAMGAPMQQLLSGIPEEIANDLIARYRMGDLKPSAFVKELTAIKKTLNDEKSERDKQDYLSKNRMAEEKNKAFFNTEDKILELDSQERRNQANIASQERMNREDNATLLENGKIKGNNPNDVFGREYKLRSQYNQLSKDYRIIRDAFEKIEVSSKLKNASGDMALVYGFMRLQDPTSTVREGEYATAENARGVPESVMNLYNKTIKGTKLSDRQREEFLNTAKSQYQIAEQNQIDLDNQYREIATMYNLDPNRVMGGTVQPGQSAGTGTSGTTGTPTVTRKRYNPQTGKFEVVQ